ncbi:MAG: type II toxin-antitoxin system VapC family toxin [Burkholderiales bacterium]
MIAVDTNVLVYAHRRDCAWHDAAKSRLQGLCEGRSQWALPWPCLHEFYSVVTHPRIYNPPSSRDEAVGQIEAWLESPSLVLIAETSAHWSELRTLLLQGRIDGPMVHDARVAAICLQHGVREFWSVDRDFGRFPALTLVNPLTGT